MKRLYFIVISAIVLLASGCNKFLDTVPDNRTEIDSAEKVRRLLANAYPRNTYALILEARCDGMVNFGSTLSGGQQTESYEALRAGFYWMPRVMVETDDSYEYFWEDCYRAVSYCNFALEALEDNPNWDEKEVALLRAEARVSRAYHHFLLVSLFTDMFDLPNIGTNPGIPYVTEPEDIVFKQYERGTIEGTLENIEKDLFEELDNLPSSSSYAVPKFRFTRDAGYAFAVRYYLFMRDYDKVIEYADKLLPNAAKFENIGTNTFDGSPKQYVAADDVAYEYYRRVLFNMPAYKTIGSRDIYQPGIYYSNPENSSYLLTSEVESITMRAFLGTLLVNYAYDKNALIGISSTNPTGGQWAMPMVAFGNDPTAFMVKFYEDMLLVNESAGIGYVHLKVNLFRLEEVLLARAEAKALTGDFQGAIDDINMYIPSKLDSYKTAHRLNKDMIIKYYTEKAGEANAFVNQYENEKNGYWNGYTGQNLTMLKSLMLTIVDLRRAEFLYEGMRYFDILRWNIQISHTDNVTNITKTLHPGDHNRILQIPESASLNGLELNPMTNITERWDNVIYQ